MKTGVLEISRRAGDGNIGQTVLRLARLAEAAHAYEAGVGVAKQGGQCKVEGLGLRLVVQPVFGGGSSEERAAHTEVGR